MLANTGDPDQMLQHLFWVCTVCLGPIKGMQDLFGLKCPFKILNFQTVRAKLRQYVVQSLIRTKSPITICRLNFLKKKNMAEKGINLEGQTIW